MSKISIKDLSLEGKRVFIRVDFNVPLEGGAGDSPARIASDKRNRASLPTIRYALDHGAGTLSDAGRNGGRNRVWSAYLWSRSRSVARSLPRREASAEADPIAGLFEIGQSSRSGYSATLTERRACPAPTVRVDLPDL